MLGAALSMPNINKAWDGDRQMLHFFVVTGSWHKPRGLKAVISSGTTWAFYESAILLVTFLERKGLLS